MLTEIRDRSSGWFAWIIAALIIIPMAFFGVQQYADTQARPTIVEIGDTKITQPDYQQRLQQEQNFRLQQNPDLAATGILNTPQFKRNVLQSMIDRELVSYVAEDSNYRISDEAVDQSIREEPRFQTDGKFDQSLYQAQMVANGRGGAQLYKAQVREQSRLQQVISGYRESALVLPDEVRSLLEIQAEKRTFDLITINQTDFTESVTVTEADIQEYYDTNIENFMEPDRTSVSYIELDLQTIAESVQVDDDTLQQAYAEYTENFAADETRETSHILLSTNSGEDEDAQLAKAEELVAQLRGGYDFAELAKEHSQDPGSAQNGGSLGDVERGEMVPEFDAATFELEAGVVSDPVKTQFGYHIIKVDKINATEPESFDSMRFELQEEEQLRVAEDLILEQADQLRNLLFEQASSLDAAAEALNLEIRTTGLFSRDAGEGIASNEVVRAAAFDDVVLNQDLNSELIELGDGMYVAIHKLAFAAAEPKKLETVSEEIKSTLTTERAIAAAEKAGDDILQRAELNWNELAKDDNVTIQTHTISMVDTERKVAPDVMREVVKMQLSDAATKVNSFTGINGDFNIVRLTQIAPGDLAQVSEAVKDATRRLIEQRNGDSLVETYIDSLSEELALEINEELL